MARLKITQIKSRIGSTERQCRNLDALGLKRINASVEHDDSKIIKGMIERVKHLVKIEAAADKAVAEKAPKAPKAEASVAAPIAEAAAEKPAKTAAEKKPVAAKKPAEKKAAEKAAK